MLHDASVLGDLGYLVLFVKVFIRLYLSFNKGGFWFWPFFLLYFFYHFSQNLIKIFFIIYGGCWIFLFTIIILFPSSFCVWMVHILSFFTKSNTEDTRALSPLPSKRRSGVHKAGPSSGQFLGRARTRFCSKRRHLRSRSPRRNVVGSTREPCKTQRTWAHTLVLRWPSKCNQNSGASMTEQVQATSCCLTGRGYCMWGPPTKRLCTLIHLHAHACMFPPLFWFWFSFVF